MTGMTTPGSVAISVKDLAAVDAVGNPNAASNAAFVTWDLAFDSTAPDVSDVT